MGEGTEETEPDDMSLRDLVTPDPLHEKSPARSPSRLGRAALDRPNALPNTPRTPSRPQPSSSSESEAAQTLTMMASTRSPKSTPPLAQRRLPMTDTSGTTPFTSSVGAQKNTHVNGVNLDPNRITSPDLQGFRAIQHNTKKKRSDLFSNITSPIQQGLRIFRPVARMMAPSSNDRDIAPVSARAAPKSSMSDPSQASQGTIIGVPATLPQISSKSPVQQSSHRQSADQDSVPLSWPPTSLQQLGHHLSTVTPGLASEVEALLKKVDKAQNRIGITSTEMARFSRNIFQVVVLELCSVVRDSRSANEQYRNHRNCLRSLILAVHDNQATEFQHVITECKEKVLQKGQVLMNHKQTYENICTQLHEWNDQFAEAEDKHRTAVEELQACQDQHQKYVGIMKQVFELQAALSH